MKKLLLLLVLSLFVPRGTFAVTTNRMDNALVTTTFQFTGGTPGASKVLTSDASGFSSWQTPAAATGPFAITNGNNFFMATSTNTFGSLLTRFQGVVAITNKVAGNFGAIYLDPGTGTTGAAEDRGASLEMWTTNGFRNLLIGTLPGQLYMQGVGSMTLLSDVGGGVVTLGGGYTTITIGNGTDTVNLGTGSAQTTVFNGVTWTAPNGFNLNAGMLQGGASGVVSNGASGFTSVGTVTTSNLVLSSTGAKLAGLDPTQVVTNVVSSVPWITITGQGTRIATLNTNSTRISTGNLGTRFDSGALGFSNALLFAQVQTNTFTATGVTTNDFAVVRLPSDLPSDSRWEVRISSLNTVSVTRQALSNPVTVYTNSFSILDLGL